MKWLVVFVAVAICLGYADEVSHKKGVLKRRTRRALVNLADVFIILIEKNIILSCKENGLSDDGAQKLQATYDATKTCVGNSRIFLTSKAEYIQQMISCARNSVSETKDCLPPSQKYFPDFILDYGKSLVSFFYDKKPLLSAPDIHRCLNNFVRPEVTMSYITCITAVPNQTNVTEFIPNSKKELCDTFLPAEKCYIKTMVKYCDHTDNVNKFNRDFIRAVEQPCDT